MRAVLLQQAQQARVFLPAATTQSDQMDRNRPASARGRGKARIITRLAILVRSRGGIGLVEFEPFLGLLVTVVVKLVVDLAQPQRVEEVRRDFFGELAGVNRDMGER